MIHALILFVCLFVCLLVRWLVGWLVGLFVCLFVCFYPFPSSRVLNLISIDKFSQFSYDGRKYLQFVFHFHPRAHNFSGSPFFDPGPFTLFFQPPQNIFFDPDHVLSRVSISNRFFPPNDFMPKNIANPGLQS